jgi:ubiquinone/menaquinone biosynthesis C-methylase UbiE
MIGRDVHRSGRYVEHFQPDDAHNPFHALYAAKRADVVACVGRHLELGRTVLDLGGGPGRMAVPLARDHRVTLCDISADMLRAAEAAASAGRVPAGNLSMRRLDAGEPLPFPPSTFDCAICTDVLSHLQDPAATLLELRRVLTPNGMLLVDASNRAPWWILRYPRALGRWPGGWLSTWRAGGVLPEWQGVVRHHRYAEYRRMLDRAGFAVAEEWRYGPAWCAKWFLSRCRPMPA